MAEVTPRWYFPFAKATSTRRTERPGTPAGAAARLIGIDGNYEAGIRPSKGFRNIANLNYGYGSDTALALNTGAGAHGYGSGGTLQDCFPVTFRVGDTTYGHGWVYRVVNNNGDKALWRMKFKIGDAVGWQTEVDYGLPKGLFDPETYDGEQAHVFVLGRFIYILRSTKRPVLVMFSEPTPGTYALNVVENTGPGKEPVLGIGTITSVSVRYPADSVRTENQELREVVLGLPVPTDPALDATAKMMFFGFSNWPLETISGTDKWDQKVSSRYIAEPAEAFVRGRDGGFALRGPVDLELWAGTPPQPNPAMLSAVPRTAVADVTTAVAGPLPQIDQRGVWAKGGKPANEPAGMDVDRGTTVWAYRLFDSRTARWSALSNRLSVVPDSSFAYAAAQELTDPANPRTTYLSSVTFPAIRIVYNKTKYDTLLLYRSRTTSGLTAEDVILTLDSVAKLQDYHVDIQPGDTDWGDSVYFAVTTEAALPTQPVFEGDDNYLSSMPFAGSAIPYEGAVLYGKMGELEDSLGGLGKAVWSDLLQVNPELVSANNRYLLQTPDEEMDRYCYLGPNVVGFSRLSPYLFRRETNYMKAQGMHRSFGLVSTRAACTVGSQVYYMSEQGLHVLDSNGAMDDLPIINHLILSEWAGDLASVSMAFDGAAGAIFILNPIKEQVVALWLKTGRMSEFIDCTFSKVMEGDNFYTNSNRRLQSRAHFFQTCTMSDATTEWRIWAYDYSRLKPGVGLFSPTGLTCVKVGELAQAGSPVIELDATTPVGSNLESTYAYILKGNLAGEKVFITNAADPLTLNIRPENDFDIPVGTVLGISPVFVEYVTAPLGLVASEGTPFAGNDYHNTRQVDGISCAFTNVSFNKSDETLAFWQGVVYSGSEVDPVVKSVPVDNRRQAVQSVQDGVSVHSAAFRDPSAGTRDGSTGVHGSCLFAGVRTFTPDLDYLLLAMSVAGNIRDPDALRSRE